MFQYDQCRSFAGLSFTHPVCRLDELLQLRRGVVGGDIAVLVAKQDFPGFQRHARRAQAAAEGVFQVVYPDGHVQLAPDGLPAIVVDAAQRTAIVGEDALRVLPAHAFNH